VGFRFIVGAFPDELKVDVGDAVQESHNPAIAINPFLYAGSGMIGNIDLTLSTVLRNRQISARAMPVSLMATASWARAGGKSFEIGTAQEVRDAAQFRQQGFPFLLQPGDFARRMGFLWTHGVCIAYIFILHKRKI
jgi:hypothetical protein